jgi:hypothetical protein
VVTTLHDINWSRNSVTGKPTDTRENNAFMLLCSVTMTAIITQPVFLSDLLSSYQIEVSHDHVLAKIHILSWGWEWVVIYLPVPSQPTLQLEKNEMGTSIEFNRGRSLNEINMTYSRNHDGTVLKLILSDDRLQSIQVFQFLMEE